MKRLLNKEDDDEQLTYPLANKSNFEEESDVSSVYEEDPDEERVEWMIWYEEHPKSRTFALAWGHTFGISCLRQNFKVTISQGKVIENKWASYGCDLTYSDDDIIRIIKSKTLLSKFFKFRENIEVNMDSSRQWCPHPNCELWVKGSNRKPKVTCPNGHKFCFICQQDWHRGDCKEALDSNFLDWVSDKGVSKCPKWKVRTEK